MKKYCKNCHNLIRMLFIKVNYFEVNKINATYNWTINHLQRATETNENSYENKSEEYSSTSFFLDFI